MTDAIDRIRSALASRYAIERQLGAGGMATVYLARDLKHDRDVALKVLRPELAAVLGAERFTQEIRITANLNHPNILPLLDSGTAEELPSARPPDRPSAFLYYVMPCIEGDTLRDRLNRDKQLAIEDALKTTEQVASALDYAHRREVIHRDIKPENILFHEGVAMVADFGIALAVKTAGGERLTETGLSLGTPSYMSPEQVAGDSEIDGRSDIYSLACLLYEMLAGEPPFTGPNAQAIVARHMTDPVPPITTVRSSVPQPVATAITKALGKAPVDRFDTANAFSEALFAESTEVEPEVKSIVVLPFDDLSPDADNQYFSDGLTEEIIADLSMLESLRVISRTSAMKLRGTNKDVREIAQLLNVQYIMEGSVRKSGNKLRITVQLIDAGIDEHVWAEKYDGVLDDVFEIQEQVSNRIVEELKGRLTQEDKQQLAVRPSFSNIGVYEAYARARFEFWKTEPTSQQKPLQLLEEAIRVFGEHPLLVSGVGSVHWQFYHQFGELDEAHLSAIQECARKLFVADPASSHGHRLTSYLRLQAGESDQAISHLSRAMHCDINDTETMLWLCYLLANHAGRPSLSKPIAERWMALDPLHPMAPSSVMFVHWMDGDLAGALKTAEEWNRLDPNNRIAAFYRGQLLAWNGRYEDSQRQAEAMFDEDPHEAMGQVLRFITLALQGRREDAREAVSPEVRDIAWMDFHLPWLMSEGFALLDEKDEALTWLERAVEKGIFNYPLLAELDPFLENIRSEKRFAALLADVKEKWDAFGRELDEGVVLSALSRG